MGRRQRDKKPTEVLQAPEPKRKVRNALANELPVRIPFRKYEEVTLEGRIVEILNNLNTGKDCRNEVGRLFKRLRKIKDKEVMNRYILSGLITLQKLIHLSAITNK
jgi:hypothetical protein